MGRGISVPTHTTGAALRDAVDRLGAGPDEPVIILVSGGRAVLQSGATSPEDIEPPPPESPVAGQDSLPSFAATFPDPPPRSEFDGEGEDGPEPEPVAEKRARSRAERKAKNAGEDDAGGDEA